jgi:hypothetical protein
MAMPRRRNRAGLLDSDAASIAAAIELVEHGDAVSVTLVGLRFGERLLPLAVAWGQAAGVSVSPIRGNGSAAISIRQLPE